MIDDKAKKFQEEQEKFNKEKPQDKNDLHKVEHLETFDFFENNGQ